MVSEVQVTLSKLLAKTAKRWKNGDAETGCSYVSWSFWDYFAPVNSASLCSMRWAVVAALLHVTLWVVS